MGYRGFVKAVVIFIVMLVPANYAAWELHTKQFFEDYDPGRMGDLARLGYMPEYGVPKPRSDERLPGFFGFNNYHGQHVDMVVIGDSFSFGVGGGEHPFFQEYIILNSEKRDFSVLNITSPRDSGVEIAWKMLNSGLLRRISPSYVLIESAERACIEKYGLETVDPATAEDPDSFNELLVKGAQLAGLERKGKAAEGTERNFFDFMTFANLKHPLYKVIYKLTDRPPGASVFKARLDRPMFSTAHPETLLYLDADVEKRVLVSRATVETLNRNMNTLSDALAGEGISLYFMPAPDKFTLYSPFIEDEPGPGSLFFALMREQEKRYGYIDTELILSEALREGVLDLYHQDDTHWSFRASERIFSRVSFKPLPSAIRR